VNDRWVVEQADGEHLDGMPLEDLDEGKNPHAVALDRLGGQKGGKARAEKLSPARRKGDCEAGGCGRMADSN
jgi:hypothetical protein